MPAHVFDNTPCGCKMKCYNQLSVDDRKKLYDGFWASGSFDVQNAYLCGCVRSVEVARRYTSKQNDSRRQCTRVYYVEKGSLSVKICKKAFLKIHGISNGRLDRALRAKQLAGGSPHCDQRGKHEPANKTKKETVDKIKAHINNFPPYKSHYSRKDNPNKEFLSPMLSIQKMYYLYKEECDKNNERPASEWVYRKIFNEMFNLSLIISHSESLMLR